MGHFGFSYIGAVFLMLLFVPNILFARRMPAGYDALSRSEPRKMRLFERAGEVLCTTCAVIFSDFNPALSPRLAWLLLAAIMMALYEAAWARYFASPRALSDVFQNLWFIPVPLASLPVAAFFTLGVYGGNLWMTLSAVILGVGHIPIHLRHKRESAQPPTA